MPLTILEPLPDEMLASLLTRTARLDGYSDYCEVAGILFQRKHVTSFIDCEIDFPRICEFMGDTYDSERFAVQSLTQLYAQAQLGEIEMGALRMIESGNVRPTLGEITFYGVSALNFCSSCVTYDINRYGFSYWHRCHQIPVVLVCPKHGQPLKRYTCNRPLLHQCFPLPGDEDVTSHGIQLPMVGESALWLGISVLAGKILDGNSMPTDSDRIRDVLLDELHSRKLTTANGNVRKHEFETATGQFFPSITDNFREQVLCSLQNPKHLRRSVTESGECRPFVRLLLIYWLFGTWEMFKERCYWRTILGGSLDTTVEHDGKVKADQSIAKTYDSNARDAHRQICIDYILGKEDPSRIEFLRTHYKSFRWLLHNDRSWLDVQLPVPPKQVVQLGLFD